MVHKIRELHKSIYRIGPKIPKRDRFGIYEKIENIVLEILESSIAAALETRSQKAVILSGLRIKTEILKRLIRSAYELNIIERKTYINLEKELQEISRMANGWLRYLTK